MKMFGYGLRKISNQTRNMCLAAVLRNGISYCNSKFEDDEIKLAAVTRDPRALFDIKKPPLLLCIAAILFSYDQMKLTRFLTSREKQQRREALCYVRDPEIRQRLKQYLKNGWNYRHLVETRITLPDNPYD